MKIARFDPAAGALAVGVECDPNRNGSYTIMLWEADTNRIVKRYPGNFINSDDDEYELDLPTSAHAGRLVEAMVVVAVPPGVGPSEVSLSVSQNDHLLAKESQLVPPGSPGQMVDLFVELVSR